MKTTQALVVISLLLASCGTTDTSTQDTKSDATDPTSQTESDQTDAPDPADQVDAADPSDQSDAADPSDQSDAADPSDQADAADPSDQSDAADPTDTIYEDLDEDGYTSDVDCNDTHPLIKPNALGYCATSTVLALSRYLSCGLISDGSIECWGYAYDLPPTIPVGNDFIAVAEGAPYYCGLRAGGTVACVDIHSSTADLTPTPTDSDFVALAGGENFMCGLHEEGSYTCWGSRNNSRTPESFVHIEGGRRNLCGIRSNGTVACVGNNAHGINNPPGYAFREITVGPKHACGILNDGTINCWGDNSDGQLVAPSGSNFVAISGATSLGDATCALEDNGNITCWGDDAPNTEKLPSDFNAHLMDSAYGFVCAMDTTGHLECAGGNISGANHSPTYSGITHLISDRGESNSTSAYIHNGQLKSFGMISEASLELQSDTPIISMSASSKRSVALHADGTLTDLKGSQNTPEPPEGSQMQTIEVGGSHWNNRYHYCGLYDNGQIQCWHANSLGQSMPPSDTDFTQVTLGADFSCGLHEDGNVSCWGDCEDNHCNVPEGILFDKIDAAQDYTCGLSQGTIHCWGKESYLPGTIEGTDFTDISAGTYQVCALDSAGVISCHQNPVFVNQLIPPQGSGFTSLALGYQHGCALTAEGQLSCFGNRYIRPIATFLP